VALRFACFVGAAPPGIIVCLAIVLFPKRTSGQGKKALAGFLVAILTLSMISASNENMSKSIFAKGVKEYTTGHYAEARLLFEKLKIKDIELSYLRYNIALCYISEHNVAGALLELYSGLRRFSTEPVLLEAIASIEQKRRTCQSVCTRSRIRTECSILCSARLWNLGFIFLVFIYERKNVFCSRSLSRVRSCL